MVNKEVNLPILEIQFVFLGGKKLMNSGFKVLKWLLKSFLQV